MTGPNSPVGGETVPVAGEASWVGSGVGPVLSGSAGMPGMVSGRSGVRGGCACGRAKGPSVGSGTARSTNVEGATGPGTGFADSSCFSFAAVSGIVRGSRFAVGAMASAGDWSDRASAAVGSGAYGGAGAGFAADSGSVRGSRFGWAGTADCGSGSACTDGRAPAWACHCGCPAAGWGCGWGAA
jgi:hypothetical protein